MPKYYIRITEPEKGGVWQAVQELAAPLEARRDYANRIGKTVAEVGSRISAEFLKETAKTEFRIVDYDYTDEPKQEFLKSLQCRPL